MRSNRERNQEHDTRAQARVRPAPKDYNFEPLQTIMDGWRSGPAVTCAQGEINE
jgi:hypothetical protein